MELHRKRIEHSDQQYCSRNAALLNDIVKGVERERNLIETTLFQTKRLTVNAPIVFQSDYDNWQSHFPVDTYRIQEILNDPTNSQQELRKSFNDHFSKLIPSKNVYNRNEQILNNLLDSSNSFDAVNCGKIKQHLEQLQSDINETNEHLLGAVSSMSD